MKIFATIILMLSGIAQFSLAQDVVQTPKSNSMSNVFSITGEAGATLGFTDYTTNKIDYMGKGSLEYYFPSTGRGNIGLRIFGQTGFIAGKNAPALAITNGNKTNEFSTKIDLYGGGVFYTLSIGDAVYPWVAFGVSNLWFYPKDGNGNKLYNYTNENYYNHMLAYNGDLGVRIMVAKNLSANVTAGLVVGSKDWLDDIKAGSNNDLFYSLTVGISYYFGRDKEGKGKAAQRHQEAPRGRAHRGQSMLGQQPRLLRSARGGRPARQRRDGQCALERRATQGSSGSRRRGEGNRRSRLQWRRRTVARWDARLRQEHSGVESTG